MIKLPYLLALSLMMTGCSVTGLGGKSSFSCGAPEGASCKDIDNIYSQATSGAYPVKTSPASEADTDLVEPSTRAKRLTSRLLHQPTDTGMPVRSEPVIMRIALFPWTDSDGILHDVSYQYVTLSTGNWLIEHNRARVKLQKPANLPPIPTVGKEASEK